MSLHRSFLAGGGATMHRNVLTRSEKLERLEKDRNWNLEESPVYGLPKVGNRKLVAKKK